MNIVTLQFDDESFGLLERAARSAKKHHLDLLRELIHRETGAPPVALKRDRAQPFTLAEREMIKRRYTIDGPTVLADKLSTPDCLRRPSTVVAVAKKLGVYVAVNRPRKTAVAAE